MAKAKKLPEVGDLNAYFFMSIQGNEVHVVYHDDTTEGMAIGAALASVLQEDDKLYDIMTAAMLTAIEDRDSVKPTKKKAAPKKAVKKKAK